MGFIWDETKEDDEKFKSHVNSITKTLSDTKEGLLADITKLKARAKEFESIDIAALQAAKTELDALKANNQSGETETQKQLRVMAQQHEELKRTVGSLTEANKRLIVDDAISKSLMNIKVKPDLAGAALLIIKNDVALVDEDGKKVAKIGDKTIEDYIQQWATTPVGKNFVLADSNTGGNAGGGQKPSEGAHEKYFDKSSKEYNMTKQILLKKADPALYSKLSAKYAK